MAGREGTQAVGREELALVEEAFEHLQQPLRIHHAQEHALLPGLALLRVHRGLVRGSGEVDVAEAAAAATSDHQDLFAGHEIAEQLAARFFEDHRSGRNLQDAIVARLAVLALAGATTAGHSLEVVGVSVVAQAGLSRIDGQRYRTAAAAVAAIRTAAGDMSLAPERRGAVAAVAAANPDLDLIEKHDFILAWDRVRAASGGDGAHGEHDTAP